MFYDLHIPCGSGPPSAELSRTLSFLCELGYTTVALNHTITGKLQGAITNPLPTSVPDIPAHLRILRRCTLVVEDNSQNYRLPALINAYDIVAVRPTSEKVLQHACGTLECDLISLDFSQRLPYHLKHKVVGSALQRGLCFEIGYSASITDVAARRNLIANAAGLIRATRGGRGIVISSEAKKVVALRAPHDVINLGVLWGLSEQKARDAVSGLARTVVVKAGLKRTSFKGVVDVVDDGVTEEEKKERKRKAEEETLRVGTSKKQKQLEKAQRRQAAKEKKNAQKPKT